MFCWLWLRSCLRLPTHWFRSERLLQSIEISPQLKRSGAGNKSNQTSLVSAWSTQQSPASSKTDHVAVMFFSVCATWSTWSTTTLPCAPFIPVAPIELGTEFKLRKTLPTKLGSCLNGLKHRNKWNEPPCVNSKCATAKALIHRSWHG